MSKTTHNTEDRELLTDDLQHVTAGSWFFPLGLSLPENYTPNGGGFQNETYDTSFAFGWSHITCP